MTDFEDWVREQLGYIQERIDKLANDISHNEAKLSSLDATLKSHNGWLKNLCQEVKWMRNGMFLLCLTIIGAVITALIMVI